MNDKEEQWPIDAIVGAAAVLSNFKQVTAEMRRAQLPADTRDYVTVTCGCIDALVDKWAGDLLVLLGDPEIPE